jgi:RNA polymerase sigma factor (sigma-70 family)
MAISKSNTTNDSQLWGAFIGGSEEAFGIIYHSNLQPLYNYGLFFSRDKELIKDCIHDVFVDLHKYHRNLSPTNNIRMYLFKSLKHCIIKNLVKKKAELHANHFYVPFFSVESFEEKQVELDEESQQIKIINQALSLLSERQREALFLRFNSELEYNEISNILQINYQSARNLIFRSIEKLRKIYAENKTSVPLKTHY